MARERRNCDGRHILFRVERALGSILLHAQDENEVDVIINARREINVLRRQL